MHLSELFNDSNVKESEKVAPIDKFMSPAKFVDTNVEETETDDGTLVMVRVLPVYKDDALQDEFGKQSAGFSVMLTKGDADVITSDDLGFALMHKFRDQIVKAAKDSTNAFD